jgi:hypothetical protein
VEQGAGAEGAEADGCHGGAVRGMVGVELQDVTLRLAAASGLG